MNRKDKLAVVIQTRSLRYTFGPVAVTCEVRHPETLQTLAYGIGADEGTATTNALAQLSM